MKKLWLGLLILGFFFAPKAHGATYTYYRSITTTSTTSVASGTNSNFPYLVSSTFSSWASTSHSGHIQNLVTAPNGGQEPADLAFATSSANCNGTSLNFETESYNSSTGALIDWVNVPSVSAGTVIYACYGDSGTTTDQSHPSSTWNTNYSAVVHLPAPTSTLQLNDSTSRGNNGTPHLGVVTSTGQIDGAAEFYNQPFVGQGYAVYGHAASVNPTSSITYSLWLNNSSNTNQSFLDSNDGDSPTVGTRLQQNFNGSGNGIIWSLGGLGNNVFNFTYAWDTNWHYLVVNYDGSHMNLYFDGVKKDSVAETGSIAWSGNDLNLMAGGANDPIDVDEFRIATTAFSPSWILTEYNNQNSPSTFYAVGSEQTAGGGGATNAIFQTLASLGQGVLNIVGNWFSKGNLFVQ